MDIFFRAVGFSNLDDINELMETLHNSPDKRSIIGISYDETYIEHYKDLGMGLGITLCGTICKDQKLKLKHILPTVNSDIVTPIKQYSVEDNEFTTVSYLDNNVNEILFILQSGIDFISDKTGFIKYGHDISKEKKVNVAALSIWGTIILPIANNKNNNESHARHGSLRIKSKNSSKSENTIYTKESIKVISTRLHEEDLLSIVDSYFLPIEDGEQYCYDILGYITAVKIIKNFETWEDVYKITVVSVGVTQQIFINKYDVLGTPMVGMRFMGTCKLHGDIL